AAVWPDVSPLRFPGVLQRIGLAYLIASLVVLHSGTTGWAIAAAALTIAHWALLAFVPFGGNPAGTITPDQNLAGYVDAGVSGSHALRIPIDPEGLLETMTTAATALAGALAGEMVRRAAESKRLGSMAMAGTTAAVVAIAWSAVLPISKPLWTGSFVLLTSG